MKKKSIIIIFLVVTILVVFIASFKLQTTIQTFAFEEFGVTLRKGKYSTSSMLSSTIMLALFTPILLMLLLAEEKRKKYSVMQHLFMLYSGSITMVIPVVTFIIIGEINVWLSFPGFILFVLMQFLWFFWIRKSNYYKNIIVGTQFKIQINNKK